MFVTIRSILGLIMNLSKILRIFLFWFHNITLFSMGTAKYFILVIVNGSVKLCRLRQRDRIFREKKITLAFRVTCCTNVGEKKVVESEWLCVVSSNGACLLHMFPKTHTKSPTCEKFCHKSVLSQRTFIRGNREEKSSALKR